MSESIRLVGTIFFLALLPPHFDTHTQPYVDTWRCHKASWNVLCLFFSLKPFYFVPCFLVLPLVSQCKANKVWILLNKSLYLPFIGQQCWSFLELVIYMTNHKWDNDTHSQISALRLHHHGYNWTASCLDNKRYQVQVLLCLALCV